MKRRAFLAGASAFGLTACGAAEPVSTPAAVLAARAYRHDGPPLLSLMTMKTVSGDRGEHTGLMINASQRVIFDPAGTFGRDVAAQPWGALVPENMDVHYGITPTIENFYIYYHARETYYVLRQDIPVTAEQAEAALRAAIAYGAVPKGGCTTSTSKILQQVPGLEWINKVLFPDALVRQVDRIPSVVSQVYRDTDSDDKSLAAESFGATLTQSALPQ